MTIGESGRMVERPEGEDLQPNRTEHYRRRRRLAGPENAEAEYDRT